MCPYVVFFIGTTAELIKLFTVIEQLKINGVPYKIIATGQNDLQDSDIVRKTNLKIDLFLSSEKSIKKNAVGLFSWFFKTARTAKTQILNMLPDVDFNHSVMVVHGDTISTVMGGIVAKQLKMKLAHVEAGLRSGHIFSPFPEEIDRHIVSWLTDYSFAPGEWASCNLKKGFNKRQTIIDTTYNTICDALSFSERFPLENEDVKNLINKNYAVFVMHRQENLMNKDLVNNLVSQALKTSEKMKVVFILHQITENTLNNLGLLNQLKKAVNVITVRRVEYFDFMKLLQNAEFVVTDGGSNQEELSYMGKPALIIRKSTERKDGLGNNISLFNGKFESINEFVENYNKYKRDRIIPEFSPSEKIAQTLSEVIAVDE